MLAYPDQFARLRRLRDHRPRYDPDLVEGFRRRAHDDLRRDPREAGRTAQLGMVVAEAIRDPKGRLGCLVERAKAALLCGDPVLALDSVEDAARIAAAHCGDADRAQIEILRLQTLVSLGRNAEGRVRGENLLADVQRSGDRRSCILAHTALADLAFREDRPRDALRHYARAERLYPSDSPARTRAVLAMNRGNSLVACGRYRAARRQFDRARDLLGGGGCSHSAAQVDYNAAYAEICAGNYREALRLHASCAPIFEEAADVRHLAHLDLDRAELHLGLHQAEEAGSYAISAEVRFLTLGLVKERAQAVLAYARAAALRGERNATLTWLERAERLFRDLALPDRVAACIVARGHVFESDGAREAARELAIAALEMISPRHVEVSARARVLLARIELGSNDHHGALADLAPVRAARRRLREPRLRIDVATALGRARLVAGDLGEALAEYELAVEELMRRRAYVPAAARAGYLAAHTTLRGEALETLGIAESSPTRQASDLVAAARLRTLVRETFGNGT